MSKHETPLTAGFWLTVANGAFVPEYPLVRRAGDCGARYADAVIFPGEPHRRASAFEYPTVTGRDVIVVQTKAARMGMYLMGQALFSARLVLAQGAASVRSILLCLRADSALMPLLEPFPDVEVWVSDLRSPHVCRRFT